MLTAGDVDSLDPGTAYYQLSYMVTSATQRTLLSWPPEETQQPQPDVAVGEPMIADGGHTVRFKIKRRVRYSPPVNRPIRSQDFAYAIERALLPGVANGYVGTYLGDLVGFARAQAAVRREATRAPDITGVQTPDAATLVLRFNQPVAPTALQALSLPIGAPVPTEYARPLDRESPSAYAQHVVATGPYMVANDDSGALTGYKPGQVIELVRNPNWDPASDNRAAYLDSIRILEGFTNAAISSHQILAGESQVNGDFSPPPAVLKEAVSEHADQLTLTPLGLYRYIALNTTIPPFDDVNVRRAVAAAIDRVELRLNLGGKLVGPVATHFLPPGMPGFHEAGGYRGPRLAFLANPRGDAELAAEYLKRAGYASGQVTGEGPLLMVGDSAGSGRNVAQVVLDTLRELGFDIELRSVSHDTMIVRFCGVRRAAVAICPNGGWLKEFNDPRTMLDAAFSGEAIQPANNPNWSLFNDPGINRAIARARLVTDPIERAQAWGAIDRRLTALVPAIPWSWDYFPVIASDNVLNVINAFNGTTDLSFASLTEP